MKIAVVILNWNGRDLLQKFLPNVVKYSAQADVYVVDNASDDDSLHYVRTYFSDVQIIKNQSNLGFAKGYNMALKQIQADVYCLLNSDVEVTPNWLGPIQELFHNPQISVVQPKILDYHQPKMFEYAGAAGGFIDKFGFPFCRGRIFDTIEEDSGQYDTPIDIFWASGACFFIRASDFDQLKGFDQDFFAHQEEIDLCWRLHHLNKRIVFCPESVVYHVGGATLPTDNPRKTYLNFRNGLFMLTKNLPKSALFPILFLRMCLDGIAGIRFLFQGKLAFTWAIVRAHFSFYRKFVTFYNKRAYNPKKYFFLTKSIVYLYFIKKKKFFSDI